MITESFAKQVLEILEYWLGRTVEFSDNHINYKYSFDGFVIDDSYNNPLEAAIYLMSWIDENDIK